MDCTRFLCVFLLVGLSAFANPNNVRLRMADGAPVVISCAPTTCGDDEAEARLKVAAQQLHERIGGRVVIVTAPEGFAPEVYAQAAEQAGITGRDVVLAISADQKHWVIRAPSVDPARLAEMAEVAARTSGIEAGLVLVTRELPGAMTAKAAPVAPNNDLAAAASSGEREPLGHPEKPAPHISPVAAAPIEPESEGIRLWLFAAVLALVAAAVVWRLLRSPR